MRAKEMYPLCCLSLESPGIGVQSPEVRPGSSEGPPTGSAGALQVAGVLFKWTNYSKGWRSRWVLLRNGVLSYSKIYLPENLTLLTPANDVRLIGDLTADRVTRTDSACARRKQQKTAGVVHLKQVLSFRESKSDNRKFYIFTATKTLHLRTNSKRDRVAWIQALVSSRSLFSPRPLNDSLLLLPSDLSVSTERLKKRLAEEGISEGLVKDCEQIMISEFSQMQGQLQVLCEERSSLLDTLRQLEAANIEGETSGIHDSEYQLSKFSSLGHGKSSECSTTESSDDIEKHYLEVSDEETFFYDTEECFDECTTNHKSTIGVLDNTNKADDRKNHFNNEDRIYSEKGSCKSEFLGIVRRKKLPDPVEKEKGVSLWCMIKDNVGKDLTRVCLPVYFNEPISSLQKCFEDLEYSYLLDRAYDYGRAGNTLLRALNVAAFAVSGYASSEGRHRKPFNPLLGETYEADYPEKGVRFFSEKVSHHPTVIACHCEGRGWKFWGDSNIRTKFWGRSIQLDPVGILTLEFDDGEIFQWSKVTTTIYNLILGKVYCDHHGTMNICGNRDYSCKLKFKERSLLERNPCQVHGFVHDVTGKKGAIMYGKWDDSMYHIIGDGTDKSNELNQSAGSSLLWRRTAPPSNLTRYNLTSFAITLNELTPGLKEKLPPTDSRHRPDQRHLENGKYEKANEEKLRLERRQRMSKTLQENGWKPRWFEKDGEDETFRYVGGYWEARERGRWDGCPDIFSEFGEELATSQES